MENSYIDYQNNFDINFNEDGFKNKFSFMYRIENENELFIGHTILNEENKEEYNFFSTLNINEVSNLIAYLKSIKKYMKSNIFQE